jgi:hypothetical protein
MSVLMAVFLFESLWTSIADGKVGVPEGAERSLAGRGTERTIPAAVLRGQAGA